MAANSISKTRGFTTEVKIAYPHRQRSRGLQFNSRRMLGCCLYSLSFLALLQSRKQELEWQYLKDVPGVHRNASEESTLILDTLKLSSSSILSNFLTCVSYLSLNLVYLLRLFSPLLPFSSSLLHFQWTVSREIMVVLAAVAAILEPKKSS